MQANRTKTLAKFTWLNLGFSVNMKFKEDFKICQTTCIDCQHADSNYLHCQLCKSNPFLLHLKGKLYYGRPLTGTHGLEATPATVGLFPPDTQGPKKIQIMLMHANDLNMGKTVDACQWLQHGQVTDDKWQVTGDFKNVDARLWIVLQYLASRSSFNDINELQTSRASTSASSSSFKLPGALSMKRMKWMSIVSSRTCHSCHHVTIMWAPCDLHVITPCLQWLLMGLCFGSSLKNYEGQLKNHTWKSWSQMKSLKSWSEIWTR